MNIGPLSLALQVAETLDELGIPYVLGGSVASSFFGEPRTTVDVDFAVRMIADSLADMVETLQADFYIPVEFARKAIDSAGSFSLLHTESGLKVDLFVLGDTVLDACQLERRVRVIAQTDPIRELWVTSPEDQVIRKLDWFCSGGGVSDRQWKDVIGILVMQSPFLDVDYMRRTAPKVGLENLFDLALAEANHLQT